MAVRYRNDSSTIGFIVTKQLQTHHQTKYNSYPHLLYIFAFAYSKLLESQIQAF